MEDENGRTINEQIYEELGDPTATQDSSTETAEATQTEEVKETETAEAAETVENQGEEQPAKNSARNRITELAADKNLAKAENKVKDAQIRSLQDSSAEIDGDNEPAGLNLPQLQPGEEISPEQYQQHVLQTANALIDLKLKARDNVSRIKGDLHDAMTEYPDLNPKQEGSFNPDLSDAVTEAVGAFIKANPTGNVKRYIDKLMQPYQKAVAKAVTEKTETVAKQASETAARPTHVKATEKKFTSLSVEEMEAKLGKVY